MLENQYIKEMSSYNMNLSIPFEFDADGGIYNNKKYKTTYINNRRYLGNKYKLLDFIKYVVFSECKDVNIIADIFAGTGAVSSAFVDKQIITNDNMYSNYISHYAWFSPEDYSKEKIIDYISIYNKLKIKKENYMSKNFAGTFFSKKNCIKIGYIRENIEYCYKKKDINFKEKAILITSLLYAMDKIANTCGHYDAYIHNAEIENKELELLVPVPSIELNIKNRCYNLDSNELVKDIYADLVYIDPPYNSRQYCDTYHLLENVATWQKPQVYGVARKMKRDNIKSSYCTNNATLAFEDLVKNINAKYILFSYNNMAKKGNGRSNARISDNDIIRILENKGEVKVFSKNYKSFTTGKSNHSGNEERLFLCICNSTKSKNITSSPFNYTGGKYRLLPQMLPYFPKDIDIFIDIFCGGGSVGLNVPSKKVILNDKNDKLVSLCKTFKYTDKEEVFEIINKIIKKYKLSNSKIKGYKFYECNSYDGLAKYNRDKFIKARDNFNTMVNKDCYYYIMFYVLIIYSFNNQIRFNKNGDFNLPIGKRDFNLSIEKKLDLFLNRIKELDIDFFSKDFRDFDISFFNKNSFVYLDPPYLISCASYNEQNGWTEKDEYDLLSFLDELNKRQIKFALSNVLKSKDKENKILSNWIKKNKYKVISLNSSYNNSNYQIKNKSALTDEVLIINYNI